MNADILIVGGGVIGLTLARELARRGAGHIVIIEKEDRLGAHASGRNSGVVHAGVYYPEKSLKAKLCVEGRRRLLEYVEERRLPVLKCGKVIVAMRPENVSTLDLLEARARANGVDLRRITPAELAEIEPEARTHGAALWSPGTAVIDSTAVLNSLAEEIRELGVEVRCGSVARYMNPELRTLRADTDSGAENWNYGYLVNCAGVHADRVAHAYGVGKRYRILPFKGIYWKASAEFALKVQRLIYPAPDVRMPFLGVHVTRTVDGHALFGPTAIPALGRENYSLLGGLDVAETPVIAWHLLQMMLADHGGFRRYVAAEVKRYRAANFYLEAQGLVRSLNRSDVGAYYKTGIRAQLFDLEKKALENDFVIEHGENSLHVLNAISPAFTSSFAFARELADQITARSNT